MRQSVNGELSYRILFKTPESRPRGANFGNVAG